MFLNIIKSESLFKTSNGDGEDAATVVAEVTCHPLSTDEDENKTGSALGLKASGNAACEPSQDCQECQECQECEECESSGEPEECDPLGSGAEDDRERDGLEPPCEPECNTCFPNECNYLEWVYVLLVNGHPDSFFEYKCNALRVMRERARNLCFQTETMWTYGLTRHVSEDRIDVVRRLNNFLITYDQVMTSFCVHQVFKKNTYN
jgi:hypothetical protein